MTDTQNYISYMKKIPIKKEWGKLLIGVDIRIELRQHQLIIGVDGIRKDKANEIQTALKHLVEKWSDEVDKKRAN